MKALYTYLLYIKYIYSCYYIHLCISIYFAPYCYQGILFLLEIFVYENSGHLRESYSLLCNAEKQKQCRNALRKIKAFKGFHSLYLMLLISRMFLTGQFLAYTSACIWKVLTHEIARNPGRELTWTWKTSIYNVTSVNKPGDCSFICWSSRSLYEANRCFRNGLW
jgi:hypothetical protein